MNTDVDVVIVGGGITGLLTARELLLRFKGLEVVVLEKSPYLGHETTTRNSGVLHSGIYYPAQSLKLKCCLEGISWWNKYQDGKFIKNIGKYIFASAKSELPQLQQLLANAHGNQLNGIRKITEHERDNLASWIYLEDALYSPQTSIIDVSSALQALQNEITALGGIILLREEVMGVYFDSPHFKVEATNNHITTKKLINAAGGVGGVKIRNNLNLPNHIENEWVKGHYLKYSEKFFSQSLLYPLPLKNLRGLGVHTCVWWDGSVSFGPDATDCLQHHYEMEDSAHIRMIEDIHAHFKGIHANKLHLDFCGIRPKIKLNGKVYPDFYIDSPLPGYVEALGIESPGLTAAPGVASIILNLLQFDFYI